jgi:hypothetical protein
MASLGSLLGNLNFGGSSPSSSSSASSTSSGGLPKGVGSLVGTIASKIPAPGGDILKSVMSLIGGLGGSNPTDTSGAGGPFVGPSGTAAIDSLASATKGAGSQIGGSVAGGATSGKQHRQHGGRDRPDGELRYFTDCERRHGVGKLFGKFNGGRHGLDTAHRGWIDRGDHDRNGPIHGKKEQNKCRAQIQRPK